MQLSVAPVAWDHLSILTGPRFREGLSAGFVEGSSCYVCVAIWRFVLASVVVSVLRAHLSEFCFEIPLFVVEYFVNFPCDRKSEGMSEHFCT